MAAVSGPFCARARTGSLSAGRSSFPRLDPIVCTSGPPSPTLPLDPAFSYLPPGLGLSIKGHSAVFLDRDDFEQPDHLGGGGASGARPSPTAQRSRRVSASAHSNANANGSPKSSDSSSSSSDTNANGSPTSSLASSTAEDPAAAARRKARTWLAAGEDPGLGAARRALWEDPAVPTPAREEEARAAGQAVREADDNDSDNGSDDDERDIPILPPAPSPSRPAHATLPPLPSCLRPPLLGRSVSGSSQASSTASVQFASEQPEPGLTYSPSDYERRGQGPVEKLSIKEWVELKSVREAVGLFSGKIAPWKDGIEPPSPTESQLQGDDSSFSSHFASASTSSDASAVLSPKRSCGQLATAAGLLSVGTLANRETC